MLGRVSRVTLSFEAREIRGINGSILLNRVEVADEPGFRLLPGTALTVLGVSGSGKTLLAWLAHSLPLIIASKFAWYMDLGELPKNIMKFVRLVAGRVGMLPVVKAFERGMTLACLDGREVKELEELGYMPYKVERACVGVDEGRLMARIEMTNGRLVKLAGREVVGRARGLVESILAATSITYSLPSQLVWLPYYVDDPNWLWKVYEVASKIVNDALRLEGAYSFMLKCLTLTRLPPIYPGDSMPDDLVELAQKAYGFKPGFPTIEWDDSLKTHYTFHSLGELLATSVKASFDLVARCEKEVPKDGATSAPSLIIDDAFDNLALRHATDKVGAAVKEKVVEGYSVALLTRKPEPMIEAAGDKLEELVNILIITYNIPALAKKATVPLTFRLKLLKYSQLDDKEAEVVHRIFIGES